MRPRNFQETAILGVVPGHEPQHRDDFVDDARMRLREQLAVTRGLAGPIGLLVTKAGDDRPVRYQLDQPFALIGRAPQTDVPLNDLIFAELRRRRVLG